MENIGPVGWGKSIELCWNSQRTWSDCYLNTTESTKAENLEAWAGEAGESFNCCHVIGDQDKTRKLREDNFFYVFNYGGMVIMAYIRKWVQSFSLPTFHEFRSLTLFKFSSVVHSPPSA